MTESPSPANADDPAAQPDRGVQSDQGAQPDPSVSRPDPASQASSDAQPDPAGPVSPEVRPDPGVSRPDPAGPAPAPAPGTFAGPAGQPGGPYGGQPGGPYGAAPDPYAAAGPYPAGLPPIGYVVPAPSPQLVGDPLISPDYGGWWQRGLALVRRGLKPLVLLQLIGLAVGLVLQIPIGIYGAFAADDLQDLSTSSNETLTAEDYQPLFAALGYSLLSAVVLMVVAAVVTIATIYIAVMIATGVSPSVGAALRGAARRAFPLIGWQLLAGLIIAAGICACILPMFYFMAVFAVLPAVVACERGRVIARCFSLFHGDLGASLGRVATIFGLSMAGGLVGLVLGTVANAILTGGIEGSAGIVTGSIVSTVLTLIVSAVVSVVTAPLTLTTYADLRARIEPLSTGVLAVELGLVAPPTTTA